MLVKRNSVLLLYRTYIHNRWFACVNLSMENRFYTLKKIDTIMFIPRFILKFCFYFQMKETQYRKKRLQNG